MTGCAASGHPRSQAAGGAEAFDVTASIGKCRGGVRLDRARKHTLERAAVVDVRIHFHPGRRVVGALEQPSGHTCAHGDIQHHRGDRLARMRGVSGDAVPDIEMMCVVHSFTRTFSSAGTAYGSLRGESGTPAATTPAA